MALLCRRTENQFLKHKRVHKFHHVGLDSKTLVNRTNKNKKTEKTMLPLSLHRASNICCTVRHRRCGSNVPRCNWNLECLLDSFEKSKMSLTSVNRCFPEDFGIYLLKTKHPPPACNQSLFGSTGRSVLCKTGDAAMV